VRSLNPSNLTGSASDAVIDSVASSTNIQPSHDVDGYSARTGLTQGYSCR